jgi:hypothetical protein
MQTTSYISGAALAAALLITPQATLAQALGLDVDLDVVGIQTDADVDVGGDSLLDADVDIGGGDDDGGSDAATPSDNAGLVDLDIGNSRATGPNGGTLINLNVGGSGNAVLDADIGRSNGAIPSGAGSRLITGDIRIAALAGDIRKPALLELIERPRLAGIDLDAVIDDRRVAIVAVLDLLGQDSLADIRAAIDLGGPGRVELLDALGASVELGAILDKHGIDPSDVLAVQVAENGAAEVIVLDGLVDVALLGDGDAHTAPTAAELVTLDIDALTHDELAKIDLDLLPDDLRTTAQLRLLGSDSDDADMTPAELAAIDLDLLSRDELAELDVDLLPEPLGAAVNLRLLAGDDGLADRSVGDLAAIDLTLLPGSDAGSDGGDTGADGGNGGATPAPSDGIPGPRTDPTTTGSTPSGNNDAGSGDAGDASAGASGDGENMAANTAAPAAPVIGTMGPVAVAAGFDIATLGCDIGVLALASGRPATPQAIAGADTLELVRIDGCQRSLVDSDVDTIRAAIIRNPAISGVLDGAQIPIDAVIGATIQDETLTLFVEPPLS